MKKEIIQVELKNNNNVPCNPCVEKAGIEDGWTDDNNNVTLHINLSLNDC